MLGRQRTALETYRDLTDREKPAEDLVWLVDWREFDLPYCSLYIVTPDNKWPCKVGISVAPRRRVMALQTSVWKPLSVAHSYWCGSVQEARTLEAKVHAALTEENKWLHGEWFDMRPEEAREMVEFSAAVVGIECHDKICQPEVIDWVRHLVSFDGGINAEGVHRIEMRERRIGLNRS